MLTSPTSTYDLFDHIPTDWVVNYSLVDANRHVLSPLIVTNNDFLKPKTIIAKQETNTTIEAVDTYLSTAVAMVIMDPYETEALM